VQQVGIEIYVSNIFERKMHSIKFMW